MLILARKPKQWIRIGDNIRICLVSIKGDGVARIGIEAPPHVDVWREELLPSVKKSRQKKRRG
jgi:carbon storage regulator